jgi:hypothetical protein
MRELPAPRKAFEMRVRRRRAAVWPKAASWDHKPAWPALLDGRFNPCEQPAGSFEQRNRPLSVPLSFKTAPFAARCRTPDLAAGHPAMPLRRPAADIDEACRQRDAFRDVWNLISEKERQAKGDVAGSTDGDVKTRVKVTLNTAQDACHQREHRGIMRRLPAQRMAIETRFRSRRAAVAAKAASWSSKPTGPALLDGEFSPCEQPAGTLDMRNLPISVPSSSTRTFFAARCRPP